MFAFLNGFFRGLFDSSDFPARWHCGNWSLGLGWLHIVSDLAIFGAYTTIPLLLVLLVFRRRDVPFQGVFLLFGAFILACGTTHLNEAIIFWNPVYRWAGLIKVCTALVSWGTVFALVPTVKIALSLRTPSELEREVQQRTAEAQMAQRRFAAVVEAAPCAMLMVDRERKIRLVNKRAEELFGYPREEILGAAVETLVPSRSQDDHPANMESFFASPTARAMGAQRELLGRRKDGTDVPIEIGLGPVDTQEGVQVIASIIDISERRDAERRLSEAQELRTADLKRSNDELEQYAYAASHDLQEPLRMVSSYLQLLKEEYGGKLGPEADTYIHFASDGSRRMQGMLSDLLAYARVESRGGDFRPVQSAECLAAVLRDLKLKIDESEATITQGALPSVVADPRQMERLFLNLLNNALKFCQGRKPQVHVDAVVRGAFCEFSVADNGIGIEGKYFDRIFAIFKRLHTQEEFPGSGIGLAHCKRIVLRHGGRIWLESTPGQGTTFFFTIPLAPGPKA